MEEIARLREGLADSSVSLVTSLKKLLEGAVAEADIKAHLVLPFVEWHEKHSK